ncbi:hypothetical protein HPG69_006371 [Diceros bicornis minor]|uniref:CWF21 domain-containing protein n=1 Tax=Diceros bicornis minor TaxID=77932 RepID=A0A7J7FM57_DICBM|nr:hypothetical protein HPG69_006371 [Diceros bicornis minor]
MSSTVNNGAASMPSPPDAANGFPQPGASSGAWPRAEEELRAAEPGLVKRAHREILDHERKRRVELKCMELQEMMEEQGYSEEETRQKVRTFRQMLMEKEGMLSREDRPGGHTVAETPRLTEGAEPGLEYAPLDEDDGPVDCDCPAACYRGHRGYRPKHWSSSSASPPPKKKKKKKGGHRRSRKKRRLDSECSCGSTSPLRKKKKSVKKHRRDRYLPPPAASSHFCGALDQGCADWCPLATPGGLKRTVLLPYRSDSGSRRKRRHRSRSPKSKRKEKNKERKRPHAESPGRRSHRHSSGSSQCPSVSSHYSGSRSPSRLSPKRRDKGRKTGSQRSSGSRSPSPSGGSGWGSPQQNGGSRQRSGAHGGRPGSAHSPPNVRTLRFAEGSRAARAAPGRVGPCWVGVSQTYRFCFPWPILPKTPPSTPIAPSETPHQHHPKNCPHPSSRRGTASLKPTGRCGDGASQPLRGIEMQDLSAGTERRPLPTAGSSLALEARAVPPRALGMCREMAMAGGKAPVSAPAFPLGTSPDVYRHHSPKKSLGKSILGRVRGFLEAAFKKKREKQTEKKKSSPFLTPSMFLFVFLASHLKRAAREEGGEVYVTFLVILFLFVFPFPFFFLFSFCNVQKCKLSLWGFSLFYVVLEFCFCACFCGNLSS